MRLCGFEGLAVAVVKQAAHDYCEALRWIRTNTDPSVSQPEVLRDAVYEDLLVARRKKDWATVRYLTNQYRKHQRHVDKIKDIKTLTNYFHSTAFHHISNIDGDWLMQKIASNLEKDPSFRILLGDDF